VTLNTSTVPPVACATTKPVAVATVGFIVCVAFGLLTRTQPEQPSEETTHSGVPPAPTVRTSPAAPIFNLERVEAPEA
jgi:hypothetical protein